MFVSTWDYVCFSGAPCADQQPKGRQSLFPSISVHQRHLFSISSFSFEYHCRLKGREVLFRHPVSLQFPDSCASPLPDLPTGRCFVVLLPGRSAPAASLLLLLSTQETREKGLMLTSAACTVSRRSSEGVNVFPLKVTEAICTP